MVKLTPCFILFHGAFTLFFHGELPIIAIGPPGECRPSRAERRCLAPGDLWWGSPILRSHPGKNGQTVVHLRYIMGSQWDNSD